MTLELGQDDLIALLGRSPSEFAITERGDLQRLLREHVAAIAPDCLVIA